SSSLLVKTQSSNLRHHYWSNLFEFPPVHKWMADLSNDVLVLQLSAQRLSQSQLKVGCGLLLPACQKGR
ncbi:hypothetical protein LED72_21395, partial [Salmonella enterica]|nr:hypothetical protein [Salmonella enterica]